jgi:hypothetical protein
MGLTNLKTGLKGDNTKLIIYGVVGLAVVGIAYFGIIKPILNTLGITKDAEDKDADTSKNNMEKTQVLSDLLYLDNKSKVTISSAKANTSAYAIYNAKWGGLGGFSDLEDEAVGAITSAGSLVNVSYIAYVFQKTYNKGLFAYLDTFLESNHWNDLDAYFKKTKKF